MATDFLKQIWPEWRIEEKPIGSGSYGAVYKAVRSDHNVESYAAIKVISIPSDSSEVDSLRSEGLDMNATRTYFQGVVNDFVSEIQLMETLKGIQNIVSVEDYKVVEKVGEIGWDIYIRMELLTPFNTYICDKKLTEEEVIKLGCDICTALEICSKLNIIHRDIKPENVFINDFGYFKLGDFGIARKLENMTGGLSQKGTYNYMAPEVANSSDYDARADIYSLGIMLYRLLNGNRLPFLDTEKQLLNPNERRNAVERRIRGEELPTPSDASPEMADLILRACAFDPNVRFTSAAEMKQALMSVANGTYQIAATDNLGKTTSVRRAPADYDKTTSVRRAPAASTQKSGQTVDTFGNAPKKGNLSKIIAAVLAVVILVGGGIFIVPKVIDSDAQEQPSETDDAAISETENPSQLDEEQIATIIAEAEVLAATNDYEGALTKIQTALVTYPDSEALQEKSEEYSTALNAQIKAAILEEAEALAKIGDYISAIAVIKDAQDTYGNDADYKSAYDSYYAAYKSEVISAADKLANSGDHLGALQTINAAIDAIGEDAELLKKAQTYENAYVSNVIAESNELISNEKYSEAIDLIDEALKNIPGNIELMKQRETVLLLSPKNFMEVCAPYHYENCKAMTAGQTFSMAGVKYTNGIVQDNYAWGSFISNLGKQYSELTFLMGHVDETAMCDFTVEIYLDSVLYESFEVKATGMPVTVTIPLTGIEQLWIRWEAIHNGNYQNGCRIGFANMLIK